MLTMLSRQQEYIALRYATEEEKKERSRLTGILNDMFQQELKINFEIREKGRAAGKSEDEIQKAIFNKMTTPTYEEYHRRLVSATQELTDLDTRLQDRYIAEIQKDIPLLLADAEDVLQVAFVNMDKYGTFLQDEMTETFEQLKAAGKKPTFNKAAKTFVLAWIEPQDKAFRKCENKTAEDKAKYKSLVDARIQEVLEALTPEVRKQIEKGIKTEAVGRLTPIQHAETFYTPNSYIAGNFMDILKGFYKENNGQMSFIPNVEMEIDITGRGKGSIPVMMSINYDGDITQEGTNSIDYNRARIQGFDTNVLDAICTILETGQNDIYVSALDALLNGRENIQAVGKKREERILLAFRKLSGTRVRLDITNELKGKYAEAFEALDLKSGVLDAAMLEYTGLELANYAGQKTYVIHVDKMPAIYQYSKAKGEITAFPTALLETPERAEERFTTLKIALLKRITLINKRVMSENTILFESLYRAAGLEEKTDKSLRKRERDTLIDMLVCWKKQGYIKDYEAYYKGKSFAGFKIEPHYINTK